MQNKLSQTVNKIVHILEYIISIITLIVLVGLLCYEFYKMFTTDNYFSTTNTYLQNILSIVVGLEFVRMLINLTPANTLEVLIVAIARQVILNHNNPISNIACVLCIGGLFAIRRFLIPKPELKVELSETSEENETVIFKK